MALTLSCSSCGNRSAKQHFQYCFLISLLVLTLGEISSAFMVHTLNNAAGSSNSLIPSQVFHGTSKKATSNLKLVHPEKKTADLLVPSQVRVSCKKRNKQHQSSKNKGRTSRDSQTSTSTATQLTASSLSHNTLNETHTRQTLADTAHGGNKRRRRRRSQNIKNGNAIKTNSIVGNKQNKKSSKFSQKMRAGNLPDIEWGSIPMEHLRQHPRFVSLPLPEDLPKLTSLEDVRNIRQDSWQWDALHDGRCTTSQAVAALGFLETTAAKILGIPPTWQRRGIGAYQRLQQPAIRTLDEMNTILLPEHHDNKNNNVVASQMNNQTTNVWKEFSINGSGQSRKSPEFAAKYMVKLANKERKDRRRRAIAYANIGMGIRMMWGNAQEATSVLTALNYFTQQNPNITVKEIGMCGAGLSLNQTDNSSASSLLIGATPDAVIEYPDGRIEALEVKNHCPFVHSKSMYGKTRHRKQFSIRDFPFKKPYVFPLYVPQLMLEMLCLGPNCRSAVMVRQTATSGALILRIRREDEWIEEMLYWLQRFQEDYVDQGQEPESNFFLDNKQDSSRYRSFLDRTKKIANSVEVVAQLRNKDIQRSNPSESMFLD